MKLYIYRLNSLIVDEYEITEISGNLIVVNNNSIIRLMDLGVPNCGFLSHVSLKKLTRNQISKVIKNVVYISGNKNNK